jgi:hypothetical protein
LVAHAAAGLWSLLAQLGREQNHRWRNPPAINVNPVPRELIEAKMKGLPIKPQAVSAPWPVIALMAALKRSLAREGTRGLAPRARAPEMLGPLRRTLGEYSFAAQYQQAPSPAEHYGRSEQLRS